MNVLVLADLVLVNDSEADLGLRRSSASKIVEMSLFADDFRFKTTKTTRASLTRAWVEMK